MLAMKSIYNRVILTTPTSSSSESERLVGDELRRDAAASFEFNFSTPSTCGRSTSCSSDVDVDIFCSYNPRQDYVCERRWWWFEGEELKVNSCRGQRLLNLTKETIVTNDVNYNYVIMSYLRAASESSDSSVPGLFWDRFGIDSDLLQNLKKFNIFVLLVVLFCW